MQILLALMLLLAGPVLAEEPVRQITVNGQAEKSFAPDKVDVTVVIEGRAKTLKEAKAIHDKLLSALHEVTAKFDIAKSDVKTTSDSINPQFDYVSEPNGSGGRQVLRGYSAEHRLQVTLSNLTKIGDFINALVAKNIDRIEQVSYGLKRSADAEMEVSVEAVKDAKMKAQKLLGALGATLGPVISVNADGGGYMPRPMPMMMAKADMAGGAPEAASIPAGDVNIRQNVTVQFEIQ